MHFSNWYVSVLIMHFTALPCFGRSIVLRCEPVLGEPMTPGTEGRADVQEPELSSVGRSSSHQVRGLRSSMLRNNSVRHRFGRIMFKKNKQKRGIKSY